MSNKVVTLDEEQMKAIQNVVSEKQKTLEKAIEEKASTAIVEEIKAQLTKLSELEEAIKSQGKELEIMGKKKEKEPKVVSFKQAISDLIFENKEEISKSREQRKSLSFEIKAVDENLMGNFMFDSPASATHINLTENTGIISRIRKRPLFYLDHVSVGTTTKDYVNWIEQYDEEGNPIFIAEGQKKPYAKVAHKEVEQKVKQVAVLGKVSERMIEDLPRLITEIQNNLIRRLEIELENGLISGDGIDEELTGITEYASDFDATVSGLAGIVDEPNEFDVIEAIATQTQVNYGIPTAVFVHPSRVSKMKLTKGDDGHYVYPIFTIDGNKLSGMNIVPTTAIGQDEFIGGDLSVVQVLFRNSLKVEMWWDGEDFSHNQRTIRVERRVVQYVSANDTNVIIQGNFTDAKAELAPSEP